MLDVSNNNIRSHAKFSTFLDLLVVASLLHKLEQGDGKLTVGQGIGLWVDFC